MLNLGLRLQCTRPRLACLSPTTRSVASPDSPARAHAQSAEVERVTGVRLVPKEGTQVMSVEYRIQWKDDTVQTW